MKVQVEDLGQKISSSKPLLKNFQISCSSVGSEGQSFSCATTGDTKEGIAFSKASESTCSFLSVDPLTGDIVGAPSVLDGGTCKLVVNYNGGSFEKDFTIAVKNHSLLGGALSQFQAQGGISDLKMNLLEDRLFFLYRKDLEGYQLYSIQTDGTNLKNISPPFLNITKYLINDFNQTIVFQASLSISVTETSSQIFVINFDGSGFKKISLDQEVVVNFNLVPSSNQIVYHDSISKQVYKMSSNGSSKMSLLSTPRDVPWGAVFGFEVVGNRLLMVSSTMASNDLFSVPLDGSGETQMNDNGVGFGGVKLYYISPDKSKVAMLADLVTAYKFELYIANIDGSNHVKLSLALPAGGSVGEYVRFTPDSSKVIYIGNQGMWLRSDLFVVNTNGTNNLKLNPAFTDNQNVRASTGSNCSTYTTMSCGIEVTSDSQKVFYIADQDLNNRTEIYSVNIDGTNNQKVSGTLTNSGASQFKLSPDETKIIYNGQNDNQAFYKLYMINSDGTNQVRLDSSLTDVWVSEAAFNPLNNMLLAEFRENTIDKAAFFNTSSGGRTDLSSTLGGLIFSASASSFYTTTSILNFPGINKISYATQAVSLVSRLPINTNDPFSPAFFSGTASSLNVAQDVLFDNIYFPSLSGEIDRFQFSNGVQTSFSLFGEQTIRGIISSLNRMIFGSYSFGAADISTSGFVELTPGLNGQISKYEILGDGRLLTLGEHDNNFVNEIKIIDADGSNNIKLNVPTTNSSKDVSDFQLTADQSKVVYYSGEDLTDFKLKIVELDGSNRRNIMVGAGWDFTFKVSPNSEKVVSINSPNSVNPQFQISNLVGAANTFVAGDLINTASTIDAHYEWMPDSSALIIIQDLSTTGKKELYKLSATAGPTVKLSVPLIAAGDVTDFKISKTGQWIIYRADAEVDGKYELYGIDTATGVNRKISGSMVAEGSARYQGYEIAEEMGYVTFLARKESASIEELYSVRLKDLAIVKLNAPLSIGQSVFPKYKLSSNGRVFFVSDEALINVPSVYWVSLDGAHKQKIDNYNLPGAGVKYFDTNAEGSKGYFVGFKNDQSGFEAFQITVDSQ